MPVTVTRLTPCFAARVDGADITRPLDDGTQIPFSRRFGGLGVPRSMNPAAGTPFARQSNLDIKTGEDIPPEGGATEFASGRAVYPSLTEALKRRAETAIAIHDFAWSRDQVRPGEPLPRHPRLPHPGPAGREEPRVLEGATGPRHPAPVLPPSRVAGGPPGLLGHSVGEDMKKIPNAVLHRCEWGRDDYSLQVAALPLAPDPAPAPEGPRMAARRREAATLPLFEGVE